jgi:hypothetical protein
MTGKFLDYDYERCKKSYDGAEEDFPLERVRLRTLWLWAGMEIVASLVFGWTTEHRVHVSVPIIGTFFLGWVSTSIIGISTTFLVDLFSKKGASAAAALNFVRCVMGAGGTASVLPIVNSIGLGRTFTLWSGIMLAALGLIALQMVKGRKWRQKREVLKNARG